MSSRKIKVSVFTPRVRRAKTQIKYFYQKSEVYLSISGSGFNIETTFTKLNANPIINKNRIRDAIKKAELLYLILYGKKLQYETLCVSAGALYEEYSVSNGIDQPLVYSMVDNMITTMSDGWKSEEVLKGIVSAPKTKQGRLFASLYALIIAKSKMYATERFMYLWMAMNGLYGEISDIIIHPDSDIRNNSLEADKNTVAWLNREYGQIKFMALLQGWQYDLSSLSHPRNEKERNHIRLDAEILCEKIKTDSLHTFYTAVKTNDIDNKYITELQGIIKNDSQDDKIVIHPYAFMTLWLPYQIRCKYFHGEFPVSLLSFENEHPLPAITVVNTFLESFLDNELPKWFDENIVDNELKPKVWQYARACKCNKNKQLIEFKL